MACCVFGCESKRKPNAMVSFHGLPDDPDRRKLWIDAVSRPGFCRKVKLGRQIVCSKHFEEKFFTRKGDKRPKLTWNAVPTLNLGKNIELCNEDETTIKMEFEESTHNLLEEHNYGINLLNAPATISDTIVKIEGSDEIDPLRNSPETPQEYSYKVYTHNDPSSSNSHEKQICGVAQFDNPVSSSSLLVPQQNLGTNQLKDSIISSSSMLPQQNIQIDQYNNSISSSTLILPQHYANNQLKDPISSSNTLPQQDNNINAPRTQIEIQQEKRIKALEKDLERSYHVSLNRFANIKRLKQRNLRLNNKIDELESLIKVLQNKAGNEEESVLLDIVKKNKILERFLIKEQGHNPPREYSKELKQFSISLYFTSPEAYDLVRNVLNMTLPHPQTILSWVQESGSDLDLSETILEESVEAIENGSIEASEASDQDFHESSEEE